MLGRLFAKPPVGVWVIKQVDSDLLHLCGQGTLASRQRRRGLKKALAHRQYRGGVRMGHSGIVLNARLFAALVPLDDLELLPDGGARWQGRTWRVAEVPQRCWAFEGRLVAQPGLGGRLMSVEDVSAIARRVNRSSLSPPGRVEFRPANALEDPLRPARPREDRPTPSSARESQRDDELS
ncbi:hypothetical protein [Halomonas cerina]|uniref:Uncharacterized protein n=1 Tax=Halomonas cerina TaxID=447424 RepID=A0A839V1E1_9GAMM|nr:hypothetical protein [Halomonas cerina]MBB3189011.1 hypothetical protein [Halomonas cerina]